MRHLRRLVLLGACALPIAPAAMAESQSSDSSSNCSNGRCTRVDRYVVEDSSGRRGWVRREAWREDGGRRSLRQGRGADWPGQHARWDDDDDDDDDD
jgi:hypothetical protein